MHWLPRLVPTRPATSTSARIAVVMALAKDLLDLLVCPACGGELIEKPAAAGLKCTECRRVYPIVDEIPVLIVEEAVIEDERLE